MFLFLKKINRILIKKNINLIVILKYFIYLIKSTKNFLKILINKKIDNLYIPNLAIRNTIHINPNKIEYINSIPMKFVKSTKFIFDFKWDEKNSKIENDFNEPTFITCNELFVQGKKIEDCKNYHFFKEQINKNKTYKNCRNHDDIINFYKKKIKLFKNIKTSGIKKSFLFNIQCMIDRNFNLVKINSRNHRTSISRILNLKKIPIEIKVIHSECLGQSNNSKIQVSKINEIINFIEKKYS